jgi:hypothetical protein
VQSPVREPTTGSDSNDGSQAHPWKTLQQSVSHLRPGDTLNVAAGSYAGFIVGWDPPGQVVGSYIAQPSCGLLWSEGKWVRARWAL